MLNENYDFVILGKQGDYAGYFSIDTKVLTYGKNEFADASYFANGNIAYAIDGKNYKRRVLD